MATVATTPSDKLFLDNEHVVAVGPVTRRLLSTGVDTLQTGLSTVRAFLAATDDVAADPIHADLDITLAETTTAGTYAGAFAGDAITAHLAALVGKKVYRIVTIGTDYRTAAAFKVAASRPG